MPLLLFWLANTNAGSISREMDVLAEVPVDQRQRHDTGRRSGGAPNWGAASPSCQLHNATEIPTARVTKPRHAPLLPDPAP